MNDFGDAQLNVDVSEVPLFARSLKCNLLSSIAIIDTRLTPHNSPSLNSGYCR